MTLHLVTAPAHLCDISKPSSVTILALETYRTHQGTFLGITVFHELYFLKFKDLVSTKRSSASSDSGYAQASSQASPHSPRHPVQTKL